MEKNDGAMDESGHWTDLVNGLSERQADVAQAMREHDLHWEAYTEDGELLAEVTAGEEQLRWKGSDSAEKIGWAEFVERLDDMGGDVEYRLCLCGQIDKPQALSAGTELGDRVAEVYRALLPLYLASTRDEN